MYSPSPTPMINGNNNGIFCVFKGFETERADGDDSTKAKWKQGGIKNKWKR